MDSFNDLKSQAESLGLSGSSVAAFIKEQQSIAREERAQEREQERVMGEQSMAQANLELERERMTFQHEEEMARINIPVPIAHGASSVVRVEKPKLPVFREGEDIPSYFIRFERIADLLELERESLAIRLGSSLTGKAADIYASLSSDTTADYDLLKQALLRGFNKTCDTYRQDFRSAKIDPDDTYHQFVVSLRRKLNYWIESTDFSDDTNGLKEFMVYDQLLSSISPDLRTFLKEKGKLTLQQAVDHADNWTTARRAGLRKSVRQSDPVGSGEGSDGRSRALVGNVPTSPHKKIPTETYPSRNARIVKCHNCGVLGHYKSNCPKMARPMGGGNHNIGVCLDQKISSKYMSHGTINGANVSTIIRDTGCSCVMVASDILPHLDLADARRVSVSDFLGRVNTFPVAKCYLKCSFFDGWVDAVIAPIKCCSVLVGNIPGAIDPVDQTSTPVSHADSVLPARETIPDSPKPNIDSALVVTRSQAKRSTPHPLKLPAFPTLELTPDEFTEKQKVCPTLVKLWVKARNSEVVHLKDGSEFKFIIDNSLLYRVCVHSPNKSIIGKTTLVLPDVCRSLVLSTAHENSVAGHFSHNKTFAKISTNFFWPGASVDVRNYCRSCDSCQRMSQCRTKPVPSVKMPIVSVPFSRVSMDIVGPLTPVSSDGHRYILTLVDWATGFPEAVPLKTIDSISVAEALLAIFSRVGIPAEIMSDQGSNFTSQLMGQLHRLLGVKPIFSSIYHAAGNGRQERVHSTLKSCLKKLCEKKPRDWHRYLVATLFAMRELPSDRTGFSAFQLLYGRQVRGPLNVLHDLWVDRAASDSDRSAFQYIIDLRKNLKECAEIARTNAEASQTKFCSYYDLKAKDRMLEPGNEALILLPDSTNKLLMSWKGPYKILKKVNRVNYLVQCDRNTKLFHINLLKKYVRRANVYNASVIDDCLQPTLQGGVLFCARAVVIDESVLDVENTSHKTGISLVHEPCIDTIPATPSGHSAPVISDDLPREKVAEVNKLLDSFSDVLSVVPGHTSTVIHKINLNTTAPIRSKVYPVPIHLRDIFNREVDQLLEQGIIQRSSSEFCSPVVLVKKSDSTYRLTVDYRTLNSFSKFDAEPAFNLDDDLHKFAGSKYYSEIDITKAYHQVELDSDSRPLTAFPTARGLMEYTRLPFGLLTACATYARLMRIVLEGINNVTYYFDNILIFSKTWGSHLATLNEVFCRLKLHGLTANPGKCNFGCSAINYLGFVITEDGLCPQKVKVSAICNAEPPTTKKGLRSILGFVSFYRKFVPNLAILTANLTDLLKKGVKEPLVFDNTQQDNFNKIKCVLASDPVLKLPDMEKTFVVRSDSSGSAVGAVLLQYTGQLPFPVAYASRKLSATESRLSTVERECLALVFSVQKFSVYLLGKPFILEVDHRPLVYLSKMKNLNPRLARWALCLQPYDYTVVYLPGSENVGADYLSRSY
jgi:hypothetical protein